MQLADLAFKPEANIEAMRTVLRMPSARFNALRRSNAADRWSVQIRPLPFELAAMNHTANIPTGTNRPQEFVAIGGLTKPELYHGPGGADACRFVVKPGASLTDLVPLDADPRDKTYRSPHDIERKHDEGKSFSFGPGYNPIFPLEQYAREELAWLMADAVGMGDVHAPIMPVKGLHENFLLAASLVMGRNGTPINLIDRAEIQANDPLRGLQPEDYARFFTPRLIDHPKLWSLLSANMLFRAFMGDVDHNPEAYVLACDGEGNVAPYICDAGLCAHYLNNRGWDFPQSMFIWKPMWAITNDFFKATQISFDREIISEILNNIYNLPSRRINEIVGAVVASAPQFTIDGKDQTIDTVCAKFESSRQTLSDYFMGYVMKNNIRLLQGKLLPAMPPPGTKRQARRPRVPSQRLDKPLKA